MCDEQNPETGIDSEIDPEKRPQWPTGGRPIGGGGKPTSEGVEKEENVTTFAEEKKSETNESYEKAED